MIVEGILILANPIKGFIWYKSFVHADSDEMITKIKRDIADRGQRRGS
jgi:uridine kinase